MPHSRSVSSRAARVAALGVASLLLAAGVATSETVEPLRGCLDAASSSGPNGLREVRAEPRSMKCPVCAGRGQRLREGSFVQCPQCHGEGRLRTNTVRLAKRDFYGPYLDVQMLRDEPGVVAFLVRRPDASWNVVAAGSSGAEGVMSFLRRDPRLTRLRARAGDNGLAVAVYYERAPKRQAKLWPAVLRDGECLAPRDLE